MIHSIKKFYKKALLGIGLKSLESMGDLVLPLIMAKIIDIGVLNRDIDYVMKYSMYMLIIAIIGYISAIACNYFTVDAAQNFGEDLRNRLFTKVQYFTMEQLNQFSQPSLITRVTGDVDSITAITMMSMRMVLRGMVTGIGAIFFASLINLKFASIFLFIIVFTVLFTYIYMKKSMPLYEKIRKQLDKLTLLLQENLIGVRVIKALSQDEYEYRKFSNENSSLAENLTKAENIMGAKTPIITYLINMGIVLVLWWGGKEVSFGKIKVGEIIALVNYLNMLVFSMGVLTFIFSISGKTMISKKRIQEVLDEKIDLDERCYKNSENNSENILEFKNVTFYYDQKSKPVLKNINFTVKKREKVGIIGGIGAGKTTLINLIPRLYTPQSGEIYLNGIDIRNICLGELRKRIGIVFQKSFLFSQSIEENMRWGDENADLNRIKEVVEIAQMDDFVDSLPETYETKVSKGGVNFSGGQKQRFSIARTILKSSEILIFDDSFSALDYITENRLKKQLLEKIASTTTITISSKVSSLINSDKILVMDKGEIVGIGTHKELLEKNEIYKEICDSQEIYL